MNQKHKSIFYLCIWLCLPLVLFSCDPQHFENMEVYNGTDYPITVVLGKDFTYSDTTEVQKFLQRAGCGQNLQHLGNNYYITGCPLEPGGRFQVYAFRRFPQSGPEIGNNQNAFQQALYSMFDTLYLANGDTLLKNPKLVENWPYKTDSPTSTYTFSILPDDVK